jgi:hypothetical protein
MKGSESTATKAVFSEVSLTGIESEKFQKMVDELYAELVKELESAGLQITNGDDVMQTDFVTSKTAKPSKDEYIGPTSAKPSYEGKKKISEGSMPGYSVWAVTRDVSFPPTNKNIFLTSNIIKSGLFYGKLATKENYNLLSVNFYVTFASFDGGKGYKDVKISTKPVMSVSVQLALVTPNGSANYITYDKQPVWASADWSEGITTLKDNSASAEFWGLAASADYQIKANSEKYMSEAKSIITNFQKDIVKNLKGEL